MHEIINMHTHIFPPKISEKAVNAIGEFYNIKMSESGTSESLIEDGKKIGVTKYLVCSTATKPAQVESINSFIAEEVRKYPEFIGYGSLHPDFENIENEIDRIISLGLKGIKLHPDFQLFNIDDKKTYRMFDYAQGKLPFLIHMGDDRYTYSKPYRLLNILEKFPKLIAIGAHLGGYRCWSESKPPYLTHQRLYIDTSSSLMFLSPEEAVNIIREHGIDRVFFGTDSPMWNHKDEFSRFMNLPLTEKERNMILFENASKFIKGTTLS